MINKLVQFFKIKVLRINSDRWDYQYAKGMWDGLRDQEMERLLVAKDMVERYVNGGNILEIGCGEGIFFNQIPENIYSFYEGIDISKVAIDKIEPSFKSLFKVADMEKSVKKRADLMGVSVKKLTANLKPFRSELLSVMFGMGAVSAGLWGLLSPAFQTVIALSTIEEGIRLFTFSIK